MPRFLTDEDGSVSPLMIAVLVFLIGFGGIAVDLSQGLREKARLRVAAEAASHAAATAILKDEDPSSAAASVISQMIPDGHVDQGISIGAQEVSVTLSRSGENRIRTLLLGVVGVDDFEVAARGRAELISVNIAPCPSGPSLRTILQGQMRTGFCMNGSSSSWLGALERSFLDQAITEMSGLHLTNPYEPPIVINLGFFVITLRPERGFRVPDPITALLAIRNAPDRRISLGSFDASSLPAGQVTHVTCSPGQVLVLPSGADLRSRGLLSDCPIRSEGQPLIAGSIIVSDMNAILGASGVPSDPDMISPLSCGSGSMTRIILRTGFSDLSGLPSLSNADSPLRGIQASSLPSVIASRAVNLNLAQVCPNPASVWTADRVRLF